MQSWSHSTALCESVNWRHYSLSSSELVITVTESLSQLVELNKMYPFRRVRSHVLVFIDWKSSNETLVSGSLSQWVELKNRIGLIHWTYHSAQFCDLDQMAFLKHTKTPFVHKSDSQTSVLHKCIASLQMNQGRKNAFMILLVILRSDSLSSHSLSLYWQKRQENL